MKAKFTYLKLGFAYQAITLLLCFSMSCATFASNTPYLKEEIHCKKILKSLWEKQGGQAMPGLFMEDIAVFGKPAEYNIKRKSIIIDPRAYRLCLDVSKGKDDALAFLLAHELVHAYQHASFSYESPGFFVKSRSLRTWAEGQKRRRKQMESKADIWGAILCYLAGYRVEDSIPLFIEKLYTAFELNDEDPLYDSKKERLAIAERAKDEAQKALQIYDMAIYLSLLQQHDKDTVLYQYLIRDFKSAEFYNNLGLSYAKSALPMLDEPYRSNPYPWVLDTESRLDKINKGQLSAEKLLLKSISQFNKAIRSNPNYLPNRINRACVFHILSGNAGSNKAYFLQQARADLAFVQANNTGPEQERLWTKSSELLNIVNGKTKAIVATQRHSIEIPACSFMSLDGVDISKTYSLDRLKPDWKINLSFEAGIELFGKALPQSQLLYYKANGMGKSLCFQKVSRKIGDAPAGVYQVGSIIPSSVRQNLRRSVSPLQSTSYLIQDALGLAYKVDAKGKVIEWVLYREV
ncbi:MAG: hypothetical protein AAFR87_10805 [Bacteroidota bacterium]